MLICQYYLLLTEVLGPIKLAFCLFFMFYKNVLQKSARNSKIFIYRRRR